MPVTPATYANVLAIIDSLVFNPSRNFLKDADYQSYIDQATRTTALEIGGVRFIDASLTTEAGQRDYVLNNQYKRIDQAQYITGYGTGNELVYPMDIITQKDQDYLAAISDPTSMFDTGGLNISGTPQNVSKYGIFWPETQTLRLSDAPANKGDVVKLWVLGVPQLMAAGVTYDGDPIDMNAIAYKACDLARLKSRETGESGVWDSRFMAECDRIRRFRGKIKRTRQLGDGRYRVTRLRSLNGGR